MKLTEKFNLICCFIAIFVSLIDIFFGIKYQISEINFRKKALVVDADIYQISKRDDGNKLLYFNYIVDNKTYEGVFVYKETDKDVSDTIKVYYDKDNPKNYTDGTFRKNGVYSIILGAIILLFGIFELFIKKKIAIEKK